VLQRGGGSFTGLIWGPARLAGPGVFLLPRPVGNRLWWWRADPLIGCCTLDCLIESASPAVFVSCFTGLSLWMPGRWPWVAGHTGCSSASTMATVVATSFGRAGDNRWSGGWLGRGFFQRRCPDMELDVWYRHICPTTLLVSWESHQAKASCFGTNGGDACGCQFPLEDVVEVFFPVTGF
jgi:hypothetical protein